MTFSSINGINSHSFDSNNVILNKEIEAHSPKRKKESLSVESDSISYSFNKKRKLIEKLSPSSFDSIDNWKSFLTINHPHLQIQDECIQKIINAFESIKKRISTKFDAFFNAVIVNIHLLSSLEFITKESIDNFVGIALSENLEYTTSENLSNFLSRFPLYTDVITNMTSLFLQRKNDFIYKILNILDEDSQINYIELIYDLKDHDHGDEILKTLYAHREKDSYFLNALILVLREWMPLKLVNPISLLTISKENPYVILLLAELIKKDRQALSFFFHLKPDPQLAYPLLENIIKYDLDIAQLGYILFKCSSRELLIETILNAPEDLKKLNKVEGLSPAALGKLLFIMDCERHSKEIPDDLKKFTFLFSLPENLPLKFKSQVLELVNISITHHPLYIDFAIDMTEFYLENPKNKNSASSFARLALESDSPEWLKFFKEKFENRNERVVFNFMHSLLNNNYEEAVVAFHHLYQKDPQALIIRACLYMFVECKGMLPTAYRALLIASVDDHDHQNDVEILLPIIIGKGELTPQQYAAKTVLMYDGDIYTALCCLELPGECLPANSANLSGNEYKIITQARLLGDYDDAQVFLNDMAKTILNYRNIDYSELANGISKKKNLFVQFYQKFLPAGLPYQPENIYLCKFLAYHFTSKHGVILAEGLYTLLKTEAFKKQFKESEVEYILKRITELVHNPSIKLMFESLVFDCAQQGPLALLIRSTWSLPKNHPVTNTDLIRTALFAYIQFPLVMQNKCVGVSLLQTLFTLNPNKPLYWLHEFATHEKIEKTFYGRKEIIFPNIVPNMAFLDIKVTLHSTDKEFLFSNELATYFDIPMAKVSSWFQEAFEQCAKQSLCSKNDTLTLPCRMIIKALAENAPRYSNSVLEEANLEFEAAIFIAGQFEPLPSRMLESVVLSHDRTLLDAFRESLQQTVDEILNREAKPKNADLIEQFKKTFNNQLEASTALYFNTDIFDTKMGCNTVVLSESFKFDQPHSITTEQKFKEFSLKLIQDTFNSISNNLPVDEQEELLVFAKRIMQSIDADYVPLNTQHFRSKNIFYAQSFPWKIPHGADPKCIAKTLEISKMKSLIVKACSNPQHLTLLLAEYANKYTVDMPEYVHRGFISSDHISNLIFDHPSIAQIATYSDAKEFFDKHQQQAEALHSLPIEEKDYRDWCEKIDLFLPDPLKNKWKKLVEEEEIYYDEGFSLGEAYRIISLNLLELCGSIAALKNTLLPALESHIYTYLISKGHNHRFIHFANTNWITSAPMHYALWVSPATLKWGIWEVDEKEQRTIKVDNDFFSDTFEFGIQ